MSAPLVITELNPGKTSGASPSEHRYYTLVLFDISHPKRYRSLVKVIKQYCFRVQKSVFEGQLKKSQVRDLVMKVRKVLAKDGHASPDDSVRIYKIAGNCDLTVFGPCVSTFVEENVFF